MHIQLFDGWRSIENRNISGPAAGTEKRRERHGSVNAETAAAGW